MASTITKASDFSVRPEDRSCCLFIGLWGIENMPRNLFFQVWHGFEALNTSSQILYSWKFPD
jgi:hypothetical protein